MCVPRERTHRIIDSILDKYIRFKEELEATEEIINDEKLMASI